MAGARRLDGAAMLRLRGKEVHYRDVGEGDAVLLLHGAGASSHVFDGLISRERERFRLICPDLPCTGRSQAYAKGGADVLASAMVELLDGLDIERAAVFGHSYGGVVAIEMAHRHRARVSGLVVASVPALGLPAQLKALLAHPVAEWAVRVATELPSFPFLVKQYLTILFGDPSRLTDDIVDGYVAAMKGDGFYGATLDALRCVGDYRLPVGSPALEDLPRAVLWGDKDRLVPVVQGEQVARALNVDLEVLIGAGHCLPEERPEDLAAALQRVAGKMGRKGRGQR